MCRSFNPPKHPTAASPSPGGASCRVPSTIGKSFSNAVSQQMAQHLTLLYNVIQSRRWPSFEKIVLSNPHVFQVINDSIPAIPEFQAHSSLLHACLRYDPPFEIVAKMIAMLTDPASTLRTRDRKGRTPLHVAAACDAHPTVIKLLSSTYPIACTMLDQDSRIPLHLACDASCNLFQEDNEQCQLPQRNAPSYDAVRALLSDSLSASLLEDEDGMNALEHAIISDASLEVVQLLQKATMESLKEQEKRRSSKRKQLMGDDCNDTSRSFAASSRPKIARVA